MQAMTKPMYPKAERECEKKSLNFSSGKKIIDFAESYAKPAVATINAYSAAAFPMLITLFVVFAASKVTSYVNWINQT